MAKSDRAFRSLSRAQPDVVAEMLRVLVPDSLPPGTSFTLEDFAPTQVDALPQTLDADCIARVGDDEIRHIEFQGYHDSGFSERCVWYHVGTALLYRGKRRVRSVALWLTPPPKGQPQDVMRADDISVRVTTIVLANESAEKLLANPKTVCLAPGANAGAWTDQELCLRVAQALREHDASWPERHVAVVAALAQKRYDAMVTAMEQMQMEPVIIEDLVRYGEDRGIAQERLRVYDNLIARRLRRPLMHHERQTLRQRIATTTLERLDDVIFNASTDDLEAWLADTDATPQHVEHK